MGIFDFFKKKRSVHTTHFDIVIKPGDKPSPEPVVDYDHLDEDGELPWGWLYHNREVINPIQTEYTHFFNNWIEATKKSPKELYPALKSFVLYLEDLEKLCKTKGECFEFWFYSLIAPSDYIEARKSELKKLTDNLDELQQIYEKKLQLFPAVVELLKANDGILQSEFKQLFDEPYQDEVSNILYKLNKEGKLERIKQGRTYILHLRG